MIRISKLTYDGLIENLTFTFAGNRPTRVDDAVAASAYGGGFEFKDAVKQANEYAGAAFGPAPAGVPAATTVPERPCMRPPRPQSRFGRRWDGGAVGVGEAVSVLRGK